MVSCRAHREENLLDPNAKLLDREERERIIVLLYSLLKQSIALSLDPIK